jgi:hypothetical protein
MQRMWLTSWCHVHAVEILCIALHSMGGPVPHSCMRLFMTDATAWAAPQTACPPWPVAFDRLLCAMLWHASFRNHQKGVSVHGAPDVVL